MKDESALIEEHGLEEITNEERIRLEKEIHLFHMASCEGVMFDDDLQVMRVPKRRAGHLNYYAGLEYSEPDEWDRDGSPIYFRKGDGTDDNVERMFDLIEAIRENIRLEKQHEKEGQKR